MNKKPGYISFTGYTAVDTDENVLDAARHRCIEIYGMGLPVMISFSGGKDSTCVLMLMLEAARKLDRLPLHVCMVDEEVIDPDTIEYVTEVSQWPEIEFHWLCVSIRHTLRSELRSHWYTWDPDERDVWARELPSNAITEIPDFPSKGDRGYGDVIGAYCKNVLGWGKACQIGGIRAGEAFNRRRAIIQSGSSRVNTSYGWWCKPIYDWTIDDVWKAIREFDWPYSKFYTKVQMTGMSLRKQRVAPWGNVASMAEAPLYPSLYPDFWNRVIYRLPELKAASRYGTSKLYQKSSAEAKPDELTWSEYVFHLISLFPDEDKKYWMAQVKDMLSRHSKRFTVPFPEEPIVERDRISWKGLAQMVAKNDRIAGGSSRDRI